MLLCIGREGGDAVLRGGRGFYGPSPAPGILKKEISVEIFGSTKVSSGLLSEKEIVGGGGGRGVGKERGRRGRRSEKNDMLRLGLRRSVHA